jgi:hypothetical protein
MDHVCSDRPQSNPELKNEIQAHRVSENICPDVLRRTTQNLFLRIRHIVDVDDVDIENALK